MPKKRARKKRQTLAMVESRALKSANTKVFAVGEDVPDDYWRELSTQYEQISLRIKRHNHKGHLQTVYGGVLFEVLQMPLFDSWLSDHAGGSGGSPYQVEVRDPNEPTNMLAQYRLAIDGPVRPPIPLPKPPDPNAPIAIPEGMVFGFEQQPEFVEQLEYAEQPAHFVGYHYPAPPVTAEELEQLPASLPFVHDPNAPLALPGAPTMTDPNVQHSTPSAVPSRGPGGAWQYPPGSQPRVATGVASIASDQLAREGQQQTKAELERERAERRAEQTRFEDERARSRESERLMREQLARVEAQRSEDAHRAELRQLEAKFEALAAARAVPAAPERSPIELVATIVAAIAPFVPVFTAMVSSGKELQAAQLQAQSAQSTAMMTMVAADRSRPQADPLESMMKLAPLVTPLLAPLLASRGSDAAGQAAMITAASEAQAQNTAIMAQLLGAIAESGQPEAAKSMLAEIIPMLPSIGDMISKAAQAYSEMNRPALQQPAPRQLPPGSVQRPAPVQGAQVVQATQAPAPAAARPAQATQAVPQTAPSAEAVSTSSYEDDYAAETYGTTAPVAAEPVQPSTEAVQADAALAELPADPVGIIDGQPVNLTSRAVELPAHLFGMLPEGLRTGRVKGWLRSVHAGDSSEEVGTELGDLIAEAMAEEWLPPEHAKRMSEQPRESLAMLVSMLPACVANAAYGESIVGFAFSRLYEHATEEDIDDDEESERAA